MKKKYLFISLTIVICLFFSSCLCEEQSQLYPYKDGDLFGYVDQKGEIAIPAQWKWVSKFYNRFNVAIVGDMDQYKKGIIDRDGRLIVSTKYNIELQNDLFILREDYSTDNDLFGYYDPYNKKLVSPQYYYIDNHHASENSPLILSMNSDYLIGYLDRNTGRICIPYSYSEPADQSQFIDGHAIVTYAEETDDGIDIEFQLIDMKNDIIAFPDNIQVYMDAFHGISEEKVVIQDVTTGLYGFGDLNGNIVVFPIYDEVGFFSEGIASVCIGEYWGHIDDEGKILVDPQYIIYGGDEKPFGYTFYNGIAVLKTSEGYMAIDRIGKTLFEGLEADEVYPFLNNEFTIVRRGHFYHLINKHGTIISQDHFILGISNEEETRHLFNNGCEVIVCSGRIGLINPEGQISLFNDCNSILCFCDDAVCFFDSKNKLHCLNESGIIIY